MWGKMLFVSVLKVLGLQPAAVKQLKVGVHSEEWGVHSEELRAAELTGNRQLPSVCVCVCADPRSTVSC